VILNSKGFADLLERGEFMRRISDQDNQVITAVRLAKVKTKKATDRLSKLENRQQKITEQVLAARNEVAGVKFRLRDARAAKASVLDNVKGERQDAQEDLKALQKEQAKIEGTLNNGSNGGPVQGNGRFIWPVNGPSPPPSASGAPGRPATGHRHRRRLGHADPRPPARAPWRWPDRRAATATTPASTTVAASPRATGHQSQIDVSVGPHVNQGEVIGLSGCTGLCFGAHLHFEVRINGSVTNPLNYLS